MKILHVLRTSCISLLLTVGALSVQAAEKAGAVVSIQGKGVIERLTEKIPAAPKAALLESDSVSTMTKSRVKMLFRDDSVLTLGENSKLIIKQYLYNPESKRAESLYELSDGKLRAVVGGKGFTVTTPTAFAAARGTVFIAWYDSAADRTGVAVIEGRVSLRNIDETIDGTQVLEVGQATFIPRRQPPLAPVRFNLNSEMKGDTELGAVSSEVSEQNLPEPIMPPATTVRDGNARKYIVPTRPPQKQAQRSAVTPVHLNLLFP